MIGRIKPMKKNILVVEDNKDMQEIYSEILSGQYNITQAYTLKEAEQALQKKKPDLIILDIIIPGNMVVPEHKDGEFYTKLRTLKEYKDIPVILVSVLYPSDSINEEHRTAWIGKPFNQKDLLSEIDKFLTE